MSEYHAPNPQGAFAPEDIEKNKVVSAFAYFIFFLPLIVCSDSPFGRFHANQGLLLLIVSAVGGVVFGILAIIPFLGWALLSLFWLGVMALAILGLVNTLNGKALELPLIGKWRIIK